MPLEVKHIYFTESELRKALVNFSVLKKQYLEIEDVQKTIIDKADSVTVSLLVDKALEFNIKALKVREQLRDSIGIKRSTRNIAMLYSERKEHRKDI